jgi:hypothetical protein
MLVWYSSCVHVARMGPYSSQANAWEALVLCEDRAKQTGRVHAEGSTVWCERHIVSDKESHVTRRRTNSCEIIG